MLNIKQAFMGALFSTICNSGTVVLASSETIQERAVTANVFAVTPSILDVLSLPTHSTDYPELKRVILGGETPSQRLIEGWSSANVDFWIAYGPTEATCTILTGLLQADRKTGRYHTTRLGQSIPNSTITLVDENLQEVSDIGIEGEIFVSGHCLAEGYWGDERLTETKFIQYQNDRTYRTGDMAKWVITESGSRMLEFLGRRDRITKIRGFLVNLSQDLDAKVVQLDEHITFSFSLVLNGMLVSVVGPEDVDTETLIARWKAISPAYMVPDHLVALSHLPMMNGKTDVKALKRVLSGNLPSTVYHVGSVTCTLDEAIMMALSHVTNIPIDHFDTKKSAVNYGVHSLTAIKVSTLCRERGFTVPVRDILLAPSIQALIDHCVTKGPTAPSHIQASYRTEEVALTPLQRGLLLATLEDPSVNYVQHISHYATSDIPRISAAWESLALTEPLFRMTFSWLQAEPTQSLQLRPTFNWDEMVVNTQQEINMALHELTTRADLGNSFAVLHCEGDELESGQSIVVWTVHHALIDGYSASLIFQKIDNKLHGKPTESSLPFTVAVQDMDRLRLETTAEAQEFWRELEPLFPKASGEIIFPSLSHSPRKKGHAQIHVPQSIDQDKIEAYARTANITPAAIYNAAWVLLLASYTGSDAIAYGAVFSGRSLPFRWTETMLGPLIETSPVVVEIDRQQKTADFLQQIHRIIQYLSSFHGSHLPSNIPSFSTTVTVQDKESAKGLSAVKQFREPYFRNTAATPLNLVVNPDGKISIFYRTESFLPALIENVGAVYSNLLSVILCDQVTVQKCLDLRFPLQMRQSLLATGNFGSSASRNCDAAKTISDLFRIAANQHSSRAAIQRADITLTYSKLSGHVDKVAAIISCLVPPGNVVAVLADRSINWIVAMLAAMQADTIYCPVDASYSAEYRTQLLERSEARLLLVPDSLQISVVGPNGPLTLAIDNILNSRTGPVNLPIRGPRPSSTAYICFTSGSTGQPKGIFWAFVFGSELC
jgi:non-ribosomal peptide synthetase component F